MISGMYFAIEKRTDGGCTKGGNPNAHFRLDFEKLLFGICEHAIAGRAVPPSGVVWMLRLYIFAIETIMHVKLNIGRKLSCEQWAWPAHIQN